MDKYDLTDDEYARKIKEVRDERLERKRTECRKSKSYGRAAKAIKLTSGRDRASY